MLSVEHKKNKVLSEHYFLDKKIPFLLKGMVMDEVDEVHLHKWGFNNPAFSYLSEEENSDLEKEVGLKLSPEKIKINFEIFSNFDKELNEFLKSILTEINQKKYEKFSNLAKDEQFIALLEITKTITKNQEKYLLYINTHLEPSPENVVSYSFGLTVLLGQALKISKNTLADMLIATIFSNIFFLSHNFEKIKLMAVKEKHTGLEPAFSQHWFNYTVKLIREINPPLKIKYLTIYQNTALDGSGFLQVEENKITVPTNAMSLIRSHVWRRHPFSMNLFHINPYRTADIIQNKSRYYKNVLVTFITAIGIFEPGSVLSLQTSHDESNFALVIKSNGIKKPIVKIILNDRKQIDYSRDLIDLNDEEYKEWQVVPNDNLESWERVCSIFKNNIYKQRYAL